MPTAVAHHERGYKGGSGPGDSAVLRHALRNRYMVMARNDSLGGLVRDARAIAPLELLRAIEFLLADPRALAGYADAVRLLPVYDQWVMGPGTADPHVTPAARRALISGGANVAIVGGVVAGTWTLKNDELKVEWFDEKKAPAAAVVADEVARIGRILGRRISAGG